MLLTLLTMNNQDCA